MDNTIKLVHMVRASLNELEVRGERNLDTLLGCIRVLEAVEQALTAPKEAEEVSNG